MILLAYLRLYISTPRMVSSGVPYKDPEVRRRKAFLYTKKWKEAHPEIARESQNTTRKKTWATKGRPEWHRRAYIKNRYGISLEQRDALFEHNDGMCHICGDLPSECIDHDHATGDVRGALCLKCNSGLGMFRDNLEILDKAKDYLSHPTVRLRGKIPKNA